MATLNTITRATREKGIITFDTSNGKAYKYNINTGTLYGVAGKPITTIPRSIYLYSATKDIAPLMMYIDRYGFNKRATMAYAKFERIYNISPEVAMLISAIIEECEIADVPYLIQYMAEHENFHIYEIRDYLRELHFIRKYKLEGEYDMDIIKTFIDVAKFYPDVVNRIDRKDLLIIYRYVVENKGLVEAFGIGSIMRALIVMYSYYYDLNWKFEFGDFNKNYIKAKKNYEMNKAMIDSKKIVNFYETAKDKLVYENDDFIVVIPQSSDDFKREGEIQHNCVFTSYLRRVINKETYVVFVRRKNEIDKPFITCEVRLNGTIWQYLGFANSRMKGDKEIEFHRAYQAHLREMFKRGE